MFVTGKSVAALEPNAQLIRIAPMNQDEYESTAFVYRLMDKIGFNEAPIFTLELVTMAGKVHNTPVLGNLYGPLIFRTMGFGVEHRR